MLLLKRIRKAHACAKLTNVMKSIDEEEIPQLTENSRLSVLAGETVISKLKDEENQGRPASMYKRRGQWIASLITSGAIVGWQSDLVDSAKGEYINFKKLEPADDGSYDGMTFTELEMIDYFERNVPMEYLIPSWSTIGLEYPQSFSFSSPDSMQDVINDDNEKEHKVPPSVNSVRPTLVMPTSILAQHIMVERTRLRSGRISVKVLLQNFHTNGKTVKKEITDDACRVLEEGATVRSSMKAMYDAIGFTSQDQFYAREEEQLKNFEEELD